MIIVCKTYILYIFLIIFAYTNAFVPHPILSTVGETSDSISHTEITRIGFIRSLARFFYDTRIHKTKPYLIADKEKFLSIKHTIDDLYKLAHPEYNVFELTTRTLPLKLILDSMETQNAIVDYNEDTRRSSSVHFDSEAFVNGSRRIMRLRAKIIHDIQNSNHDLTNARHLIGQTLHTLQDFYSHSNWIEMGKTDINELIGFTENIGLVAAPNQSTCTSQGCRKIQKTCSFWQWITLKTCPLVYYDCQNNILSEINEQQLLTSGYLFDQLNENNELINKPTNVQKCSHGSYSDASSHLPAIGGINKDSNNLIFSPHSNLHFKAASFAINATERFFNDLRRDIGDENFDRLFAIHSSRKDTEIAINTFNNRPQVQELRNDQILSTILSNQTNMFILTDELDNNAIDRMNQKSSRVMPQILANKNRKRKKRFIGNGSFELARKYSTGDGSTPYGITAADLDNKKQLEIIVTFLRTGQTGILTAYDAAEFNLITTFSTGSAPQPYSLAVGKFDNDHRSLIVTANSGNNTLNIVFPSNSDMEMTYSIDYNSQPEYVITCDVDNDKQLDIVSVNTKSDSIHVTFGDGNGTFEDQVEFPTDLNTNPF